MQKYLQNTILLFIFSCFYACSTSSDVPLPITTANEEALELYNTGWYHWGDHDAVKQSESVSYTHLTLPTIILV